MDFGSDIPTFSLAVAAWVRSVAGRKPVTLPSPGIWVVSASQPFWTPTASFAMPILPTEPDCHPADLWDRPEALAIKEAAVWWCLHTKPRQEKATARELRTHEIAYYLPQVVKQGHTPGGRKIQSLMPLFPSYVFINGDAHDRLTALRGHRLVSVLEVLDQESLAHDLRQIHTMLGSGLVISPELTVPVGATVRIVSGPLRGMEGTVIRRGKRDQFVAMVNFLGRGANVDLQDWQVELVHENGVST